MFYRNIEAASATAPKTPVTSCGVFTVAADPDFDGKALAEEVGEAVADALPDADDEGLVSKLVWFVRVAVKPVTFVQLELTVLLTPSTKLTAAHCEIQKSDTMGRQTPIFCDLPDIKSRRGLFGLPETHQACQRS